MRGQNSHVCRVVYNVGMLATNAAQAVGPHCTRAPGSVRSHHSSQIYDVVIAGGGMVGATLAALLGSNSYTRDLNVLVLDRMPLTPKHNAPGIPELRVSTLTPASAKVLHQAGVWGELVPRSAEFNKMQVWDASGPGCIRWCSLDVGEQHMGWVVENSVLNNALLRQCQQQGVELLWPTSITGIRRAAPTNYTHTNTNTEHLPSSSTAAPSTPPSPSTSGNGSAATAASTTATTTATSQDHTAPAPTPSATASSPSTTAVAAPVALSAPPSSESPRAPPSTAAATAEGCAASTSTAADAAGSTSTASSSGCGTGTAGSSGSGTSTAGSTSSSGAGRSAGVAGSTGSNSLLELELEGGRKLWTRLLVAADGGNSAVRQLMGLRTWGWQYGQRGLVASVETEPRGNDTAWQRFLTTGPLALLPVRDGYSNIVWSCTPEMAAAMEKMSPQDFAAAANQALQTNPPAGLPLMPSGYEAPPRVVEWVGSAPKSFPLQLKHSGKYVMPRVALVGDAAHVIHPLAGQGVHLGLMDAGALAAALAWGVGRGCDVGDLLLLQDRYETPRLRANIAMSAVMDGIQRTFSLQAEPFAALRTLGMSGFNVVTPVKNQIMKFAMGL